MADVVVVGGGIIGLSVAWNLASAGASVTVLERSQVGDGASNASAGMLAPLAEANRPGPFLELGLASLRLYPAFIDALREQTGMNAECASPGLLRVALNEQEASEFCTPAWQRAVGLQVELLDGAAVRELEPGLSEIVYAAALSPEEKQYDPRDLVRMLALACVHRGVKIRECTMALGFVTDGDQVTGVRTATEVIGCDQLVIAGGAWADQMTRWLGGSLPVYPVRGQILALRCLPSPIRYTLYAHDGYLVPRVDGEVLVGATAEHDAGFDMRPTAGGMQHLLTTATKLVPSLASAPFDRVWAGPRPGCRDNLPILGALPRWSNVNLAAGHFRNGVLLAPVTGQILTACVLGGEPHPLLPAFSATRFEATT